MSLSNTAEGGTDLTTVATTDVGSGDSFSGVVVAAGGIAQYTNVAVAHGSLAYRFATRATAGRSYVTYEPAVAVDSGYGQIYFMTDEAPSAGIDAAIFQIRELPNGNTGPTLNWGPGLNLRIVTPSIVEVFNHGVIAVNTWYRYSWFADPVGTTCNFQGILYQGDSLTPLSDSGVVSVALPVSFTTFREVRMGVSVHADVANAPTSTGYVYMDDMTAFATSFPPPSVTTTILNPTLRGASWS